MFARPLFPSLTPHSKVIAKEQAELRKQKFGPVDTEADADAKAKRAKRFGTQ
jgi:hypothetical protein